jgi:uncharacterized RDD family membrane protein YckC
LSTSASQAGGAPPWKQEVNRRVAAHKSRKGVSAEPEEPEEGQRGAGSRAAEAAARVAARYAKAPSYNETLAGEARAAVRAAEAASRAAQKAQAAAESVLAELEAASGAEPASARARHGQSVFEIFWEDGRKAGEPAQDGLDGQNEQDALKGGAGIAIVEAAQPIHAHLIEFPRELVAVRKARPQRAAGPHATASEPERQMSIFEVDPGSILIQPAAAGEVAEAAADWSGPEWLGMRLAEEPAQEETGTRAEREATASAAAAPHLAPIGLRLMAAMVDGALITGAFLAAALVAAANANGLPTVREMELGAAAALAVIGVLYLALFFTLAEATPGMKYAGLSLCTFDGGKPTGAQRRGRLGALLLSLLPMGLGVAWAIFDEEHLSWHDRLSRTYLRKR